MKKRLAAFLLILLMNCPCALGEMDYTPYLLEGAGYPMWPTIVNSHTLLTTGWSEPGGRLDLPWHVTWWQDGQVFRDLSYMPSGTLKSLNSAKFIVKEDGTFRVVVNTPWGEEGDRHQRFQLFAWTEKGLEDPIEIPSEGVVQATRSYVCAYDRLSGDDVRIRLYDADGTQLLDQIAPLGRECMILYDCVARLSDGAFLVGATAGNGYRLMCLADGGVRWQKDGLRELFLCADGQGGYFHAWHPSDESYAPLILAHYDRDGRETARKTLTGDRVVINGKMIYDAAADTLTAFGRAVANSRRLYTVYVLKTDGQMNLKSLENRALNSAYGDYEANLVVTPDGAAQVFTRPIGGSGTERPVLIPLTALPITDQAGLKME